MFDKPEIGKLVTVVTDWSDYITPFTPTGQSTKTGTVVPNNDWDDPASFNITTGKTHFPVANIQLHRVISLEYNDGSEAVTLTEAPREDVETWLVSGSKGAEYTVTRNGNAWGCECKGFSFRRACKHINEKKEEVLQRSR